MDVQRISAAELKRLEDAGGRIAVLDARSPDAWDNSDAQIPGSLRVPPDEVKDHLSGIPRVGLVVVYCT